MALKLHNSLSRELEEFSPVNPPNVSMYVCGPTVYGHSHLGHAKSYVSFDAIVRWLRYSGYNVTYVQNITDVGHLTDNADDGEDKVIAEARRRGLHPMAVVEFFVKSYYDDMDGLNVLRPDIAPRATAHIPEQIEACALLIERGHAYAVNGSVYFDVGSFADYGKLSGRNVEEMEAGARVAVSSEKRHPADFALWKRAEPNHIMQWNSPWGAGYPGWHLECSVMGQKYLGETIDIHGGGLENKFPHHECEIAQGESCTGKQFVRYWLHNNMVTLNGQKMGKSLGNAISLKQVFAEGTEHLQKTFDPVVVRHFILASHYRQPLDFSSEALHGAESGSFKLRDALQEFAEAADAAPAGDVRESVRRMLAEGKQRFAEAMNQDFNTAQAIAACFDLCKQVRGALADGATQGDAAAAHTLLRELTGDVLGFDWPAPLGSDSGKQDALIGLLADLRAEARKDKNFALSDAIRDRLAAMGVQLRDGAEGTTWSVG